MKIGYICTDWGIPILDSKGSAVHIREMCHALSELGHELFILCAHRGTNPLWNNSLKIYEIVPNVPLLSRLGRWRRSFRFARSSWKQTPLPSSAERPPSARPNGSIVWRLCHDAMRRLFRASYSRQFSAEGERILQRERPDALYERYNWYGYGGIRLAKKNDLPLLMEVNTSFAEMEPIEGHSPLYFYLMRQAEKEIWQKADALVVVSQRVKEYIASQGVSPQKIHILPNGVDPHRFQPNESARAEIREKYDLDDNLVVGFLGNFKPWHGVEVLLKSARQVVVSHPKAHFLIVGYGPLFHEMQEYVSKNGLQKYVTFTGNVPHQSVAPYIAAMDIGVVPSPVKDSFWGSPIKLFEYMAMARPVIASDAGQMSEIIVDGENGLLVKPGDEADLTKAILQLLDDAALRTRLGRAARKTVEENYTWEKNATKVIDIFDTLLAERRRGSLVSPA